VSTPLLIAPAWFCCGQRICTLQEGTTERIVGRVHTYGLSKQCYPVCSLCQQKTSAAVPRSQASALTCKIPSEYSPAYKLHVGAKLQSTYLASFPSRAASLLLAADSAKVTAGNLATEGHFCTFEISRGNTLITRTSQLSTSCTAHRACLRTTAHQICLRKPQAAGRSGKNQ